MSLNNKFTFLKDYLELNNYDFIAHGPLSEIFDSVFEFFNNRTKWNLLAKAKDKIQKLNLEIKVSINDNEEYNGNFVNQTSDSHNIEVEIFKLYFLIFYSLFLDDFK